MTGIPGYTIGNNPKSETPRGAGNTGGVSKHNSHRRTAMPNSLIIPYPTQFTSLPCGARPQAVLS